MHTRDLGSSMESTSFLVPPFLVNTAAGDALWKRMQNNDWVTLSRDAVPFEWLQPCDSRNLLAIQRKQYGMKRGPENVENVCGYCDQRTEDNQRCGTCLAIRYCSRYCQRAHWSAHKTKCQRPEPKVVRHVCVSLPDFTWCRLYVTWFHTKVSPQDVVVMLESRESFIKAYGEEGLRKTLLSLALRGHPEYLMSGIFVRQWMSLILCKTIAHSLYD